MSYFESLSYSVVLEEAAYIYKVFLVQLKAKSLEHQILEVKLKQQEEINKQGEANLQTYTEQIAQLLQTEQDLRGRLALYGEKFEQFQVRSSKHSELVHL